MNEYKEPELTIVVLDFLKETETRLCLESIKRHVKFSVKTILYHNGNGAEYPYQFFREGLCDTLIQTQKNEGLGIGTRDTFNAVFSPWTLSLQNDQIIGRDFTQEEFDKIKQYFDAGYNGNIIKSISLAGPVCGQGIYSERCHIIKTDFYKWMEKGLPYHGCGPYHDGEWRESYIQRLYKANSLIHFTDWPALVVDNGRSAKRQNPDGSLWEHQPDRKGLRLINGPVRDRYVYPYFTPEEWDYVISTQSWPEWQIPEKEKAHSFHVWN